VAFLLIIDIFTLVLTTIGPGKKSIPVHFVIFPVSSKLTTVVPHVGAIAVDVVIQELAIIS
jgi:hypothetical protein